MIDVVEARYLHDYTVWVKFEDGTAGEIDLRGELHGPLFEPLRDLEYFRRFMVSTDLGTISWPNGADFAPEFLYERLHVAA
jgi:hypothetical protein